MKKNKHLKKAMPWLLIVFGIVMIIERIWPEKWDNDNKNSNSVEKQQL